MADIVKSQKEGTAEPGVLQQSEQPFRLLVENAQDIIYRYRVSPRPGFEYLSPALTTLTGYTPEEGYADALFGLKLIHPDDWPRVQPYFQEQDKFGQCFSMRLVAKDGSLVWVEQTNVPIYDEAGRLVALEGISRDITRRVKTEEKLRESESRYSSLFETNHAVMLLIDPETGSIVDANPAACAYYSYSREDLSGKKISEINTLSPEQIFQEMQRAKTQERNHFHFRHRLASGEVRDVEVYSGPIRMHGRLLLYSIVHDVTESKRVQTALRRSEERFRQVIVSISAHIYVTEIMADGRRLNLYLSPHVEAMTGYPLERFTADWSFWPSTVIHPDDRAIAAGQAGRLAMGENSEVEYRLVRADGRVIWVRDSARVESEDGFKIIYGLVSDITGRKQVEEKIRQLNEELEQRVVDRTRELSALYDVTAVASEAFDLATTLERSLARVLAAMRSEVGAIYLLNEAEQVLQLVTQRGFPAEELAQRSLLLLGSRLTGWVVEHTEPLLVADLAADPRLPAGAVMAGLCTYIGAPIRAGGQTLGVLSVFGRVEQQFTVEEVALLASIADQVGVAVENARLHRQAEQAAVMEERERLARELHDSATQSLYSLTLFAEAGWKLAEAGQIEAVKHNLTRIGETAQQALKEMRLLVYELRPLDLERTGLVTALHRRLNAVEGRANVKARLVVEELVELPAPVEEELYRIAQEALNNALRHAGATTVTVYLRTAGQQVELEVVDDGIGFDFDAANNKGGLGLVSMQERAAKLGGVLSVRSTPGEGTRVKVQVAIGVNPALEPAIIRQRSPANSEWSSEVFND